MGQLTVILGGARSGKSMYGQHLAEAAEGDVIFLATAQPFDADMQHRIDTHRDERPSEWQTIEEPINIADALQNHSAQTIVVDCATVWVSNLILQLPELDRAIAQKTVQDQLDQFLTVVEQSSAHFIVISNEVGLGIIPENRLARIYRDILGRVNQQLAKQATDVILLVAGIPMKIK